MKLLKKLLYFIRCDLIFILSHFIPKNKKLWIFGSSFGQKYWGNTKYFFNYLNKNHPDIQAVWLTKNTNVLNHITNLGYKVYDACSIKGIWLTMRAYCCFITHDLFDINEYASGIIKIIQLRRGTPFLYVKNEKKLPKKSLIFNIIKLKFPLFMNNATHWDNALVITTSKEISNIYVKYFNHRKNLTVVTGYPRNDILLNPLPLKIALKDQINAFRANGYQIGIFIPHGNFTSFTDSIKSIHESLDKIKTVLFVHPYSCAKNYGEAISDNYKNIIFLTEKDIQWDLYPILPYMDFLITDYSTIFFDFLLLDKPILFAPLDINLRFFYSYSKIAPGPILKIWDDLTKEIKNLKKLSDKYAIKRKKICDRFNTFKDAKSCERVFKETESFLSTNGDFKKEIF